MTGRIVLEEDDASAVERMLMYLYTLDYDDGRSSSPAVSSFVPGDHDAKAVEDDFEGSVLGSENHEVTLVTAEPLQHTDQESLSAPSEDDQKRTRVIANMLLSNIQVYAVAEKYDIPELKELAKSKFLDYVDFLLSVEDYAAIIKLVYESTPNSDRGLRDAVALACIGEIRTMVIDPVFIALLRDVGDFGVDILCGSLKSNGERLDQMLASNTALKDEMKDIRVELAYTTVLRDAYKEQVQQVVKVVNAHTGCRHCDAEFNEYLEIGNVSTLRCAKCRTRHQ